MAKKRAAKRAPQTGLRDRIVELRRVRAGDLLQNPENWRTHGEEQMAVLGSVLSEVGIADAVLAFPADGLGPDGDFSQLMLFDGHARTERDKDQLWPVIVTDLTLDEARLMLATIDPLAAMAGTDQAALQGLLGSISNDLAGMDAMFAGLLADSTPEPAKPIVEDEVPDPPVDPVTKPGDLWILGEHRLLCGDSTKAEDVERLMDKASINMAFTSPPYASQREYDESSGFKPIPEDEFVLWWEPIQAAIKDRMAGDGSFFVNIKPACEGLERSLYVFDLVLAMKRKWGWLFAEEFCWERVGIPQQVVRRFKNQFEPVYQFTLGNWKFRPRDVMHESDSVPQPLGKGAGNTSTAKRQGKSGAVDPNEIKAGLAYPGNRLPTFASTHTALGHSAAFPVGLPSFFIKAYSDTGDAVYEPFCGSGSTLIAAEQLGRKCYGMEISPQYCDVIVKRWETLTGKTAELVESPNG
jgi:hypothetical protein